MKKRFFYFITLLYCSISFAQVQPSIIGLWKTFDDHTHQPKAIIQIYTDNHLFYGKVLGGYPVNGIMPQETCPKCPAPFTDQPVTGMRILWNLHYNAANQDYEGGQILDPDAGKIYQAMLTPSANGQTLKARGYISIPLLGRTQIWYRLAHS
ncbi:MAG: DUF2147 domain-containing protein [Gammaproteobacteria bacterium]|nr:DUF2147 domain-containing protein [Gammaproteobacteria bacterium]